RTLPSITVQPT
nr:immunoglobulin heavy chain junction region [Mus musculus]